MSSELPGPFCFQTLLADVDPVLKVGVPLHLVLEWYMLDRQCLIFSKIAATGGIKLNCLMMLRDYALLRELAFTASVQVVMDEVFIIYLH